LTRAELGGKTATKSELSSNLGSHSRSKRKVEELEGVADDIEVSGGEDEDDGGGKGDTSCARVLPAQEAVEHAMVV
jgi:hypothetical protein